jgi:SRSO17 transposase
MKPAELAQARGRLVAFAAKMLASLPRSDQRRRGETYLRGLMLDGRRKSIEPMTARLADGDEQCLQQFVSQSPWEWPPVRERLATRMQEAIAPLARIIDDTGFPKAGRCSVGVARQYSGTLGKVGNCQIGVSVSAASEAACRPLTWRLFLPAGWGDDTVRCAKAHLPPEERHRPKWQLALEMLDELRQRGLSPPPLVADAGYGEITAFRAALEERELAYVVEVKAATSAYEKDVLPERPAWRGSGRPPQARYRRPPASLRALALAAGSAAACQVAWREGSRGPMAARFLALRVRPESVGLRRAHPEALPLAWLLCQWPEGGGRAEQVPARQPARGGDALRAGAPRHAALAHRAGLPRAQGRPRPRSLRGALVSRLAPPRHAGLCRIRLPHPAAPRLKKRMRRPEPVRRPAPAAAADGLLRPAPARPADAGCPARLSSCTLGHDHT